MPISPVILKEFRTLVRSRAAYWFLFALLVSTGLYFVYLWSWFSNVGSLSQRALFSRMIFMRMAIAQFFALGLIAPVMASSVVTIERENRTLDLLLCTGVTRFNILLSKWLSTIAYQLLLAVCVLPILSLTLQLGGVGADEYVAAGVIVFQAVLVYGMVGLACSCWFRRSASATMAALFIVLGLALVPAVFAIMDFGSLRGLYRSPGPALSGQLFLAISPLISLNSDRAISVARYSSMRPGSGISAVASLLGDSLTRLHFLFQAFLFCFSSYVAWKGIGRKESARAAVAKKIIDDPKLLDQRRNTWPFYLIDPLKRAQRIEDGQNPVYVKEQRIGLMSRPHVLIRLSYVGLFISAFLCFVALLGDTFEVMSRVAQAGLFMAFLLGPVVAAPSVSREREEKTLDLLRVTPLSSWQIVFGKFMIAIRFMAVIAASAILLPVLAHLLGGVVIRGRLIDGHFSPLDLPKIFPPVVAFLALYAAVAVYCSSAFRRNVTAMSMTYGAYLAMSLVPLIAKSMLRSFPALRDIMPGGIGPILSPFFFFNYDSPVAANRYYYGERDPLLAYYWLVIIVQFVATSSVAWFFLRRAARRLEKSLDS